LGFAIASGTLANPFPTGDKEQLHTLDTLCSLSYPSELSQAQTLCTKRGFALLKNILGDSADFWPATFKQIRVKIDPKLAFPFRISQAKGSRNDWWCDSEVIQGV
jgi:hypothetical protein